MVSPVTSVSQQYETQQTASRQTAPPAKPAAESAPQDTVNLSSAARGGDKDHDGDSH